MKRSEKIKKQLGMSIGMAAHKLRKIILFEFVKQNKRDVCYRCGNKIETVEELSIEHKEFWFDSENPVELFFDLNNITFSHFICNSKHTRRRAWLPEKCGTVRKYVIASCRCVECKGANAKQMKKYRSGIKI